MSKDKKQFRLFDLNRNGKGVPKNEDKTPNVKRYFKLMWRNLSKLLSVNLISLFMIIPIVAIIAINVFGPKTPTQMTTVSVPLLGVSIFEQNEFTPALDILRQITSDRMELQMNTPFTMILIVIVGAFLIITWGWQNIGITYLSRNIVKGDPVFVISDYFYAIKRNWKQGLLYGVIDFAIIAILVYEFIYYYQITGQFFFDVMFYTVFALAILYFIMRFYTYLLIVTFDIKLFKVFKHALLFAVLGIKRNALGILAIVMFAAVNYLILSISVPLGLALPFVYFISVMEFTKAYCAYPNIEKYMILPADKKTISE